MTNNHFDPDAIFAELEKATEDLVVKEEELELLEAFEDKLLAKLIDDEKDSGTPATLAKEMCKKSEQWATHRKGKAEAKRRYRKARLHYENLVILAELRRTHESSMRAMRVT